MDTKEYTAYQQSLKAYWDLTSSIQSSFELGVEKERLSIANRLHKKGMSVQEIADLIELSESEVQRLITPD